MAMRRLAGGTLVTSTPPMKIVPSVTTSRPAIMRRSVDLPQPDGPSSAQNWPSSTLRSSILIASTDP